MGAPHWFIRYKLYHLPFWFAYHFAWWSLVIGSPTAVIENFDSPYMIKFAFYVIFQAAGVYLNLYFLIPRFLENGRYALYIFSLAVTTFLVAVAIVPGYFLSSTLSGNSMEHLYGSRGESFWYFFQVNTLASSVASMMLAMSVKLTKNWIQSKQLAATIEKEKLETELKFLKSQLNPHFLFNTINSIFVLISKDPERAAATLARFSDLLRYQLYDCNDARISLDQELAFIRNYVELERLRHEKNLAFAFNCPEDTGGLEIAPFIFLPFIENAFKHVAHSRQRPGYITAEVTVINNELRFTVENSSDAQQKVVQVIAYGGIGLTNVQRRLDLIYPGRHGLKIDETATSYRVELNVELETTFTPSKIILQ